MKLATRAGKPANVPLPAAGASVRSALAASLRAAPPLLSCAVAAAGGRPAASKRCSCWARRSAALRFCLRAWRRLGPSVDDGDGEMRSTAVLSFKPFCFDSCPADQQNRVKDHMPPPTSGEGEAGR